jgi:lipoprotein-anchoring transpeptidase ErfK/SrfK
VLTEDHTDELVLLLERTVDAKGRRWVRVRLPSRTPNKSGWVPQRTLGVFYPVNTWLKISRNRFTATLIRDGHVVFRARIGHGKRQWPTPRGEFYVRNRLHSFHNPVYGPVAFGTSAKSSTLTDWPGGGVIGIHGTNQPGLIPGRISHGCIRLKNKDILRLDKLMPVGTPISIH